MKDLSKQYHLLTPEERFRLFVDAMSRGDEQELDRLENSCPRKTYTMQDYEYVQRKMRFITFALATALEQMRLELLAHVALVVGLTQDDDESQDKVMDAFLKLMQTLQGKREGWERFCRTVGAKPNAVSSLFDLDTYRVMVAADEVYRCLEDSDTSIDVASGAAERESAALGAAWGDLATRR